MRTLIVSARLANEDLPFADESSDPVINAETIAKNVAAFKARQKGSRRDGKGGGSGSEPGSECVEYLCLWITSKE